MSVAAAGPAVRQLPLKARSRTRTIRIWNREGTELVDVVLDLDELSEEHAAWIERKRRERGEVPKRSERLT